MSPRLPTQRHPCPRNWQKPCRLETSLSAKRSGAVSSDTSARHSGHCDFCGSQSSRQAPQKTCLRHRSARGVSMDEPLGKARRASSARQWRVVVCGHGARSLHAHPHAVRTGCVKSFRQIGQMRLGSGGLSSSCSGSSHLFASCSRLRGGGGGAGPANGGATGRSQLVSLVSMFQK